MGQNKYTSIFKGSVKLVDRKQLVLLVSFFLVKENKERSRHDGSIFYILPMGPWYNDT